MPASTNSVSAIRTVPRGGMYLEIGPPTERLPEDGDFAPRSPTDCPWAKTILRAEGCNISQYTPWEAGNVLDNMVLADYIIQYIQYSPTVRLT